MRPAFLLVLLGGAVFYTYVAFVDLGFMTRTGRLGPGFFPRIIGLSGIALILWVAADHLRTGRGLLGDAGDWRDVVLLMALAIGYAVCLRVFGGFVATVIYLAVALSLLNRGRPVLNGVLALCIPGGVYLLFDKVLNANMPPALLSFSF
jgi:hypothetical protein